MFKILDSNGRELARHLHEYEIDIVANAIPAEAATYAVVQEYGAPFGAPNGPDIPRGQMIPLAQWLDEYRGTGKPR